MNKSISKIQVTNQTPNRTFRQGLDRTLACYSSDSYHKGRNNFQNNALHQTGTRDVFEMLLVSMMMGSFVTALMRLALLF